MSQSERHLSQNEGFSLDQADYQHGMDEDPEFPTLESEIQPNQPDEIRPHRASNNYTEPPSAWTRKLMLREAKEEIFIRRSAAEATFRRSLIVASNAVQSVAMLENLEKVMKEKSDQGLGVTQLKSDINAVKKDLDAAVHEYNEDDILDLEGLIEKMTLTHDPMYLEREQSRKKKYMERRRKEGMKKNTWLRSPSSRFVSLTKGDLAGEEEITEEDQRRCISWCAWGFAIIGMLIAISFSIVDFWTSQVNPAVSTHVYQHDNLSLPLVFACMNFPFVPTFQDLPNGKYAGFPLWGLRSYTNEESGEKYIYPETVKRVTEEYFTGGEHCESQMKYLSKEAIESSLEKSNLNQTKCSSCLVIGRRERIVLSRNKTQKRAVGAVTLEFAVSRDLEYCFNPFYASNGFLKNGIKTMIKTNADGLLKKGSLVLINGPSVAYAIDYGFEAFAGNSFNDREALLNAETTVLCNIYLFSGYFFPVKPGTEIRYSFDMNGGRESWKQIGDAKNFLKVNAIVGIESFESMNRTKILKEMRGQTSSRDFSAKELIIFIHSTTTDERAIPSFYNLDIGLRENHRDTILYEERLDEGIRYYSSFYQDGGRKVFMVPSRFRRYNISLDVKSFLVERIISKPTTSTPEFLTDVFEYIGLFTGICAYSVLVSPARMYLKRSRKRR